MAKDRATTSAAQEVAYIIDMDLNRQRGRSPEFMLFQRCCDKCRERIKSEQRLPSERALLRDIVQCCSTREGYLSAEMPLLEAAFRVMLSRGNEPISLRDLYRIVAEEWATPLNPRNVTIEGFQRILERDNHYGFRAVPHK